DLFQHLRFAFVAVVLFRIDHIRVEILIPHLRLAIGDSIGHLLLILREKCAVIGKDRRRSKYDKCGGQPDDPLHGFFPVSIEPCDLTVYASDGRSSPCDRALSQPELASLAMLSTSAGHFLY